MVFDRGSCSSLSFCNSDKKKFYKDYGYKEDGGSVEAVTRPIITIEMVQESEA